MPRSGTPSELVATAGIVAGERRWPATSSSTDSVMSSFAWIGLTIPPDGDYLRLHAFSDERVEGLPNLTQGEVYLAVETLRDAGYLAFDESKWSSMGCRHFRGPLMPTLSQVHGLGDRGSQTCGSSARTRSQGGGRQPPARAAALPLAGRLSGLGHKFAHVSGVPDTPAPPRKAGASSAPAPTTASRPSRQSRTRRLALLFAQSVEAGVLRASAETPGPFHRGILGTVRSAA
jgi:hypothetical protein